jgi:hypothetical protein
MFVTSVEGEYQGWDESMYDILILDMHYRSIGALSNCQSKPDFATRVIPYLTISSFKVLPNIFGPVNHFQFTRYSNADIAYL